MKRLPIFVIILFTGIMLHSVTLSESVDLALKNNKTILKAKEEVDRYKQAYKEVKGHLLPQLSLNGGYQYKYNRLPNALTPEIPPLSMMLTPQATADDQIIAGYIDNAFSNLVPDKESKTYNLAGKLQLNQVIFMGGKLINGINIAGKLYHLQEKKYFITKQEIVFKTIDMFYKCKLARKVADIQKDAYSVANKHLNQVKKMYEEGLVSEYDFLRAKLEVEKIKPELLEAEKNSDLALDAFAKFLGVEKSELELEGEIKLPKIEKLSLKDALQKGFSDRMELKLADIAMQVSKVKLRYEKGNFLPNIGLSAEYDYYGSTEDKFKKDNFGNSYQVGIGFSMPLFTGFSNSAKISQAKHQYNQAHLDYENLKDMIELDIKNSYRELQKDLEKVKLEENNIKLSKRALEIANARYKNQLSNQLEIFDAQLQLKSARLKYLNAVYNVIMDNEKFKKAIGKNLYKEVKNEK